MQSLLSWLWGKDPQTLEPVFESAQKEEDHWLTARPESNTSSCVDASQLPPSSLPDLGGRPSEAWTRSGSSISPWNRVNGIPVSPSFSWICGS